MEDLAGLIRELKLVKPVLMGHSMGRSGVAWFAAKYPGRAVGSGARGSGAGSTTDWGRRALILKADAQGDPRKDALKPFLAAL